MKLNKESQEFADLVLKYYSPKLLMKKREKEQQKIEELINEQKLEKADFKTKYSIDYEKFQNYLEQSDKPKIKTPEEIEIEKIIQSNPYLSQIACTHDRRKEREIYEKSNKEKFDNIEYFKSEGNSAFKNKEYDKAGYFYQKALVYFDYTFPEGDQEEKRYNLLLEQCNNNMAQCKMSQGNLEEAENYSYQALKVNPNNEKAKFRQAKIAYMRDDFEKCESLIKLLNQDNLETQELMKMLYQKQIQYQQKSEKVYQKMFQQ